jgi:multicomponent Na+:H+ antiporter subunit G
MGAVLEAARALLGGAIGAAGICALIAGAIGVLRLPDVYTRIHAINAGSVLGAPLVLLGLAIVAHDWGSALRLLVLAALILVCAPVMAHVLANAAHAAGLAPVTGKYVAPRPGARS